MIDILMCTYNGMPYIEDQLQSILNQTYTQWQLYVSDDGSNDDTWDLLQRYEKQYSGKIHIAQNQGAHGAKENFWGLIHRASKVSKADYVMFCDQDDVWMPDKIERTLKKMQAAEQNADQPVLVATDLVVVDEQMNELSPSFKAYMNLPQDIALNRLILQNNITGCTVMINPALLALAGKVEKPQYTLMHDHFLAIVAMVFGQAVFLEDSTIYYRQHGHNSVGAANAKSIKYNLQRLSAGKQKFRHDMYDSACQVAYFLKLYGQDIEDAYTLTLLKQYKKLWYTQKGQAGKLQKWHFLFKYHVLKKGLNRVIMQLIWI